MTTIDTVKCYPDSSMSLVSKYNIAHLKFDVGSVMFVFQTD